MPVISDVADAEPVMDVTLTSDKLGKPTTGVLAAIPPGPVVEVLTVSNVLVADAVASNWYDPVTFCPSSVVVPESASE